MKRAGVKRGRWQQAFCLVLIASGSQAQAQAQRPDAGTLQEPKRLLPGLPAPGGPVPVLPPVPARPAASPAVRIIPTAFRIQGATVFPEQTLAALLSSRLNRPTDLAGLQDAARQIKSFYQDHGYLLTDVYLPEQALRADGGPVTLAVVEAQVGRVSLKAGEGVSVAAAERIVRRSLQPGNPITEYRLDEPVLLLRDLPGYDATATVTPGASPGQSDITLDVRAARTLDSSIGLDNHGTRAAGQFRAFATVDANNLTGAGDQLQARVQVADIEATRLFRLSYTLSLPSVSRLNIAVTRTEYALGKQFAALGATGHADVASASLVHPLVRSRNHNLLAVGTLEHKQLHDSAVASASDRRVVSARIGLLGNFLDEFAGGNAFTSFAASATQGRVALDDASLLVDQGPGGLRTAGSFSKLNLEAQRAQFFGNQLSLHASMQAQWASRNLSSAEKMSLGGPQGVRGYAVGEGVGDSGALLGLELRYQLPAAATLAGEPVSFSAFYDVGTVRFNQEGTPAGPARQTLDSMGLGLLAGRVGRYLVNASLAWRVGSPLPSGGEPDRSPRVWLTTQKWF